MIVPFIGIKLIDLVIDMSFRGGEKDTNDTKKCWPYDCHVCVMWIVISTHSDSDRPNHISPPSEWEFNQTRR